MSKLNEFIAQVKDVGISRTNRYSVVMAPPQNNWMGEFSNLRDILLFCDQVQLPGVSFATIQNRSFGEFREVPYEKLFNEISMSFYVDQNLYVKSFFDAWVNSIQNPNTRTFAYYKSYITQMTINVEDVQDNVRYKIVAHECYPKTVSPIQLDYASKDIMRLQVSMMYKYWTTIESTPIQYDVPINNLIPEAYMNDFKEFQLGNPMGDMSGFGNGW